MVYESKSLENLLEKHEGNKPYAYVDTTGHETIGIGRNISRLGKGLTQDEIYLLLRNDIDECYQSLCTYPWFHGQDNVRQDALIELRFNMGLKNLLTFKKFLDSMLWKDYEKAVEHLLDSKWATQVGGERRDNISHRIATGEIP